jgi:hypothetical protein
LKAKFSQALSAEFDGEHRCSRRPNDGRVCHAYWIEDRGQRREFVEFAAISFPVMALQHDGYVGEFMFVPGHRTSDRLVQFRKHNVIRAQASLNWRVELSTAQDFAGLGRLGHECSDVAGREWSTTVHCFGARTVW